MSKTIKQIADELNVDKQRVYRYIKKNHINEAHHEAGVMYFDDAAISLIKQGFLDDSASLEAHHEAHHDAPSDAALSGVVTLLQATIDTLQQQLASKDAQIASLQQLLDQEQKLHLRTQQAQLRALLRRKTPSP